MQRMFGASNNHYTDVFKSALHELMNNGSVVKPRGKVTREISPATMIVDPRTTIYASPHRRINYCFLLAENLWYLSGRADTHLLSHYNSNIKSFSQDGLHDGAYGPKIISQIRYVVETLQADPDSRQAVISLWERNPRPSKDVPCTSLFQFLIRNGKLNMCVTMRSNDIIFGSNYDMPSFAMIQLVVASCLGLPPGNLALTANSLHIYETHYDMANALLEENIPTYLRSVRLMSPPHMTLEEHTIQIDRVLAYEGIIRHWGSIVAEQQPLHSLKPFYQQYVLMFAAHYYLKKHNRSGLKGVITKLQDINSPFALLMLKRHEDFLSA